MRPLIKRLGQAFVSKHAAEPLKRSAELFKHTSENMKHSAGHLGV